MSEQSTGKGKPNSAVSVIVGLLVLFAAFKACDYCSSGGNTSEPATVQSREQRIKDQFSAWDGSHKKLEAWVKSKMNDPSGYEHVETRHDDPSADNTMSVSLTFRGKNAFGAVVRQTASATVDLDGNFIGTPIIF